MPPEVAIPESWLDVLDESIKHRGPDGKGRFRDRAVRPDRTVVDIAFVHRRMSIIDLADGHQPMVSERGREGRNEGLVAVVFNGCIYNHRELRKELVAAGHQFVTDHSDTEVLVHGWRQWADELPSRLDGMYAYALWDRRAGQLRIARDFAGEKPLYYWHNQVESAIDSQIMVFSSTVSGAKQLRSLLGITQYSVMRSLPSIDEWIAYGWNPNGTELPLWGINPLPPHGVEVAPERSVFAEEAQKWVQHTGVWHRSHKLLWIEGERAERNRWLEPEDVDTLLAISVEQRLEADVPLGVLLSGGVDSSLIAAHAHLARPDITAFTVRMPASRMDESSNAAAVARHLGMRHEIVECEAHGADELVRLIEQLGLPFGDSSLLPTHWVCRAASKRAKVLLSGDGADELFGGYERYRGARIIEHWRHAIKLMPISFLRPFQRDYRVQKAIRLIEAARDWGYVQLLAIFPYRELNSLLSSNFCSDFESTPDPLRVDFERYLPEDILRKTDAASMAVPIELRAPFLAVPIVERCLAAPLQCLMPRGQRKGLLRAVARKYFPSEIVDRPKMGFAIPIGEWFRTDYGGMNTLLMDMLNSADPFPADLLGVELNRKFIQQMVDEHMAEKRDHSQRLYMLTVLAIWVRWLKRVRQGEGVTVGR